MNNPPTRVYGEAFSPIILKRHIASRIIPLDLQPVAPLASRRNGSTEVTPRQLAGRLIAAQENERKRIARELHDDFSQRLALLSIELDQLGNDPDCSDDLSNRCRKLHARVDELSVDIHRLSHRLHPSRLDHLGVEAAVNGLCRELSEGQDLKIKFSQKGFPATLPGDVTLCVFRIAQEALRNCIKHSGATIVRVSLERTVAAVQLTVADNGCGFDTDAASAISGLGFVSMKERLELVGGVVNIHSKPGLGTRLDMSVPLDHGSEPAVDRGDRTARMYPGERALGLVEIF